jgi:hypothetical protein
VLPTTNLLDYYCLTTMVYTYHVIMLHSQRLASERASATDYRVMPEVKGGQQQGSEEHWDLESARPTISFLRWGCLDC